MKKRLLLMALISICSASLRGQGVTEFNAAYGKVYLNMRFGEAHAALRPEPDKYGYARSYRLDSLSLKTLHGLPIRKILLQVEDDTITAVKAFLPFDSTLYRRIEAELGPPSLAWMRLDPEHADCPGIIRDRKWVLDGYWVWLQSTRYMALPGEEKEDLIIVSVFPRRMGEGRVN